ncbi:MAG: MarR family transcriptional regulator [Planctomycetes bacterium]|nr:MarR family transcriptional regulator [Planctomycetota bacterium]
MQTETGQKQTIAATLESQARVLVFRSSHTCGLQRLVQESVWAAAEHGARSFILPAGPYRYPYACALQLVRMVQGVTPGMPQFADDQALSREALVSVLRELICQSVVIGLPRLDQVDVESVLLFSGLLNFAEQCKRLGIKTGIRLIAGVPEEYPSSEIRALLESSFVQLIEQKTSLEGSEYELSADEYRILGFLRAAPSPLAMKDLAGLLGMEGSVLTEYLRSLHELGLAYFADTTGAGSGLPELLGLDAQSEEAFQILADSGPDKIPEARLWLERGENSALAEKLGRRAFENHEFRAAMNCFRQATKTNGGRKLELELAYGQALVRVGSHGGALGIYQEALDLSLTASEDVELGRLAVRLSEFGMAQPLRVDQILRRAERGCRGNMLDAEVEIRTLRAQLMIKNGEGARATTLLRRVLLAQLEKISPSVSVDYYLTLARASFQEGRPKQAEKVLKRARDFAESTHSRLQVETAILSMTSNENLRKGALEAALEAAAQLCLADKFERLLSQTDTITANQILQKVLCIGNKGTATGQQDSASEGFKWLEERGAVLMAGLNHEDELEIFPGSARSKVGISAWLESSVRRLQEFPGVQMTNLHAIPVSGTFSGELLMTATEYAGLKYVLVLFRKDRVLNIRELLQVLDGQ